MTQPFAYSRLVQFLSRFLSCASHPNINKTPVVRCDGQAFLWWLCSAQQVPEHLGLSSLVLGLGAAQPRRGVFLQEGPAGMYGASVIDKRKKCAHNHMAA